MTWTQAALVGGFAGIFFVLMHIAGLLERIATAVERGK